MSGWNSVRNTEHYSRSTAWPRQKRSAGNMRWRYAFTSGRWKRHDCVRRRHSAPASIASAASLSVGTRLVSNQPPEDRPTPHVAPESENDAREAAVFPRPPAICRRRRDDAAIWRTRPHSVTSWRAVTTGASNVASTFGIQTCNAIITYDQSPILLSSRMTTVGLQGCIRAFRAFAPGACMNCNR